MEIVVAWSAGRGCWSDGTDDGDDVDVDVDSAVGAGAGATLGTKTSLCRRKCSFTSCTHRVPSLLSLNKIISDTSGAGGASAGLDDDAGSAAC